MLSVDGKCVFSDTLGMTFCLIPFDSFREATLRLCNSLDIETALKRCFEYIRPFIPVIRIILGILDPDLNLLRIVASVGAGLPLVSEEIVSLPEKGRNERVALFKKGEGIRIDNQPDPRLGIPEIRERLGLKPNDSTMAMFLNLEGNRNHA
jgi:hypothetical protein